MVLDATINSEATANIHRIKIHTPKAGWGSVIILIVIHIAVGLWFLHCRRMRRHQRKHLLALTYVKDGKLNQDLESRGSNRDDSGRRPFKGT
jgi:hypothetical protein